MRITTNYCYTETSAFLKAQKRPNNMPRVVCILFLMAIAALFTDRVHCMTKEEVATTIVEHFLKKIDRPSIVEEIYKQIEYRDSLYTVDLKDYPFMVVAQNQDCILEHWKDLRKMLVETRAIRCHSIYICNNDDERPISFTIVKMLIERVVVIDMLRIKGIISDVDKECVCSSSHVEEFTMPNAPLGTVWSESNPMWLSLKNCSNEIFETIMKHYNTRPFRSIFFSNLNIKKFDLGSIIMHQPIDILFIDLLELESIVFSPAAGIVFKSIYLNGLPQLKELVGIYSFLSTGHTQIKSLNIDENLFRFCGRIFTEEIAASQGSMLEIEDLRFINMPFTSKKIESLFSSPWIRVKYLYIQVKPRTCYMDDEDIQKMYTLEVIARMGVFLLEGYMYSSNLNLLKDIDIETNAFLKSIAINSLEFGNMEIECSGMDNMVKDDKITCRAPHLYIYLRRSEEIQEAIKKFQEEYDTLCVHVGYSQIIIDGLFASENYAEVFGKLLSCMGHGITVDHLYFYNMEDFIWINIQEEVKEYLKARKYKFIFKKLYFKNCKVDFIRNMLTQYSYSPDGRICIDYTGIKEEEIWSLFRDLANYQFSSITIRNASKLVQRMIQRGYLVKSIIKNELVLEMGSIQWFAENLFITECIFSNNFTLSPIHLSTLASKHQESSKKSEEQERLCHLLVGRSVTEACAELKDFSTIIENIAYLDILMCNSDCTSFTTVEELSAFIKMLKGIFVDVKVLSIFNLRIKEEETHKLSELNALVDIKGEHKLKNIFLRKYKIDNAQNLTTSEGSETKTLNYNIGGSYLIYLLRKKLKEKNVAIAPKALPFIFESNGESNSNANLEEWEQKLVNDEQCSVCYNSPETSDIYIMHRCKHWICQPCAVACYAQRAICPFCRAIANFDKPFLALCPKDATQENLTEDDFEFVEINHL
ncbi:hypothetical protein NEFER03_0783 [Nematocida sp. LUAm3]|nr:hypothetical protein NEFER03_0783 [Nematocida sp. LUAm3]KAI5175242.1 hypothetical protein NEFER02_1203 [Nematocida sp. LUAm2]KAI5178086.1 hypothetical protein NEFER01_1264 [Nematocida sp. LUAm1]